MFLPACAALFACAVLVLGAVGIEAALAVEERATGRPRHARPGERLPVRLGAPVPSVLAGEAPTVPLSTVAR